jgi:hypothetical protein
LRSVRRKKSRFCWRCSAHTPSPQSHDPSAPSSQGEAFSYSSGGRSAGQGQISSGMGPFQDMRMRKRNAFVTRHRLAGAGNINLKHFSPDAVTILRNVAQTRKA